VELGHDLRIHGRTVSPPDNIQKSVLRDRPPTGVLQGRSYDPEEAL